MKEQNKGRAVFVAVSEPGKTCSWQPFALEMQDGVLHGASLGPCWSGRCPPLWPRLDPGSLSGWAAATACPVPPPRVLICPCNHSSKVTSSGKSSKCPLFTLGETISESH